MHILDDIQNYNKLDPSNMLAHLHELPEKCESAWREAMNITLPGDYSNLNRVIILGMGGSAIGGELAQSLVTEKAFTAVHRDYGMPYPLDEKTLVIASSYSGETEETLDSFSVALDSPAKSIALTTGGRVKELAERHGKPVFTIKYKAPPRAALAYSLMPTLAVLHKVGLIADLTETLSEAKKVMESLSSRISETVPVHQNRAKQLALRLQGRLTVLYGAGFLSGVAHRWKTQINENSKAWAFYEIFPELNHNAAVGYEFPGELLPIFSVLLLRSSRLHPRILKRYHITAGILDKAKIHHEFVDTEGKELLSQMMFLVLLGDYVSYYMALLNKCDPMPVKVIDHLKKSLSEN